MHLTANNKNFCLQLGARLLAVTEDVAEKKGNVSVGLGETPFKALQRVNQIDTHTL